MDSITLATNVGPTQVLRTAPANQPLHVEDIAAKGRNIATVWSEIHPRVRSFVRWSTDASATFHAKVALAGRSESRVGVCAGFIWVLSAAGRNTHIDALSLDGSIHRERSFSLDTHNGDVACVGIRGLATVWERDVNGRHRLDLRIWTISGNGRLAQAGTFDLGAADTEEAPSVTATNATVYVAWMNGRALRLKTVDIGPGADLSVTPHSTKTITTFVTRLAGRPSVAADGSRVVLAYRYKGEARVRISDDRAQSFRPFTVLVHMPPNTEGFAIPLSVDAFAGRILVEVDSGCCAGVASKGFLSSDGGSTWPPTPTHKNGEQLGALFGTQVQPRFAEAWDDSGPFPTQLHQKVRFHTGAETEAP
jgi:hypothetical protein